MLRMKVLHAKAYVGGALMGRRVCCERDDMWFIFVLLLVIIIVVGLN